MLTIQQLGLQAAQVYQVSKQMVKGGCSATSFQNFNKRHFRNLYRSMQALPFLLAPQRLLVQLVDEEGIEEVALGMVVIKLAQLDITFLQTTSGVIH